MADVNIDVVSEGAVQDVPLLTVRDMIADEITAGSVPDMVRLIEARLQPANRIRRLRIWGHGAPGLACVGNVPRTLTLADSYEILARNSLKTIRVVRMPVRAREDGPDLRVDFPLLNREVLASLTPQFAGRGWVEIHSCRVAEGQLGLELLKALARLWRVRVAGGTGEQGAGGGFENDVYVASPGGGITTRTVRPPPGGCSVGW